eukprot:690627_1
MSSALQNELNILKITTTLSVLGDASLRNHYLCRHDDPRLLLASPPPYSPSAGSSPMLSDALADSVRLMGALSPVGVGGGKAFGYVQWKG